MLAKQYLMVTAKMDRD